MDYLHALILAQRCGGPVQTVCRTDGLSYLCRWACLHGAVV